MGRAHFTVFDTLLAGLVLAVSEGFSSLSLPKGKSLLKYMPKMAICKI